MNPAEPRTENRKIGKQRLPPEVLESGNTEDGLIVEEFLPPRPTISRWTKWAPIARGVLGAAVVLTISSLAALGARHYVTTSPRFALTNLSVTGAHRHSRDEISQLAGLPPGTNVFSLDLDAAKAKLLSDPWVREAHLMRRLPGTVTIDLVEHEAGALVALSETYLATRQGEIFKRFELGDPTDLPVVTGIVDQRIAEDREGVRKNIARALDLASDYQQSPIGTRSSLQEIHLEPDGGITLVVGKNSMTLALGTPPYRKKLEQAARVFAELDKRGAKAEAIMLDNEARPDRVVVRMK